MTGSSSPSSSTPRDPAVASRVGKRTIEQVHDGLHTSSLEDLVARKDDHVSLATIRDVLMDHLLGRVPTTIKHTVLFVCEEVPDLRPQGVTPQAISSKVKEAAVLASGDLLEGLEGDYQCRCRLSEGDSIPRCDVTLLRSPVSKHDIEKEKHAAKKAVKKKIKKFKKSSGVLTESAKPSAEFYVLSPDELKVHLPSVPFEDASAAANFVSTKALLDDDIRSAEQLFLALDCEMCRTTKGVELTRVTLIDACEKVLLDEYVRPKNPIVDYCTQYSGITREIMEATDIRLENVQEKFLALVPAEAILVGHSIENDLLALRVLHRRVIDTACMYPHPKGPPFRSALRFLTSRFLSRVIQTNTNGHCSVEDAVATLQLAQLKIKRGPTFPCIEHEYKQKKVVVEMAQAKKSVLIVDSQRSCRSLSGGVACMIPREDSRDVVQTVVHQLTTGFPPHLTWARVRGAKRSEVLAYVLQIKANLPKHSCLVTVLSGDTSDLRALHKCRTARIDPRSSLMWDKEQQHRLDTTALATQTGLVHIYVQ
uniref:Exonuclease domain-containing protein n=1 Tax=Hyaloperonospora arabidopsidis (strain Emoy2) TaxID=559515 RepID=M4BAP1_HYAAE